MGSLKEYVEIHKNLPIKVWLKDTPKRRLSATLKFENNRIILEIEGVVLKDDKQVLIESLFGSDANAQYFVFVDCHMMMVTHGHRIRTFLEPEKVIFYSEKPIKWQVAKANYIESTFKYLDYWLGQKLFDVKLKEHRIDYSSRWTRKISVDPDLEIAFYSNIHNLYNYNINRRHRLDIEQKGYFSLKYTTPVALDEALDTYTKVENLLKLAYFSLWSEEYFTLAHDDEKFKVSPKQYLPVSKELYYPRAQLNNIKLPPILEWMFLFTFNDIENKTKFFKNWLQNEEELSPIYLPIINLMSASLPEEYKFLGLINALELIHRRRYPTLEKRKKDYLRQRNKLFGQITVTKKAEAELLKSPNSMTGYGYQLSFKGLMNDLVTKARKVVYIDLVESDIDDISKLRRQFVHNNFAGVDDPLKIYKYNRSLLKTLLTMLLLDLSFSRNKANKLITSYSHNNNLNIRY